VSDWSWIAASCRGTSHVRSGTRLQDAQTCFYADPKNKKILAAVVSDGAGSAAKGGQGASMVCRHLKQAVRGYFAADTALPSDEIIQDWVDQIRDLINGVAQHRGLSMRDFAATLVFAISDGVQTIVAHIGDGSAVAKLQASAEWSALSWPEQGTYAATTYFITDDTQPRLRINRISEPIEALALFSDGIERLALDFAGQRPLPQFFEAFTKPVSAQVFTGKHLLLSRQLREFLNTERVTARTDDDKTLILAVKK
jgi:hypothetical protein